jgi:hypothetical protein
MAAVMGAFAAFIGSSPDTATAGERRLWAGIDQTYLSPRRLKTALSLKTCKRLRDIVTQYDHAVRSTGLQPGEGSVVFRDQLAHYVPTRCCHEEPPICSCGRYRACRLAAFSSRDRAIDGSSFQDKLSCAGGRTLYRNADRGLCLLPSRAHRAWLYRRTKRLYEYRSASDRAALGEMATELVGLKVDVLAAAGVAAFAAQAASASIPIVFGFSGDPVEARLVDNLPRPGHNV